MNYAKSRIKISSRSEQSIYGMLKTAHPVRERIDTVPGIISAIAYSSYGFIVTIFGLARGKIDFSSDVEEARAIYLRVTSSNGSVSSAIVPRD